MTTSTSTGRGPDRPARDSAPAARAAVPASSAERPPERQLRSLRLAVPVTRWAPTVTALIVVLAALLDLTSALTPEIHWRVRALDEVVPGAVTHAATAATVVSGVLLLLVAKGLRRRKRRAWVVTVALVAATIVFHVFKGLDYEEAATAVGVLAWLLLARDNFRAAGDPRTRWRGLGVGLTLVATSVVIGLLLFRVRQDSILPPHPLSAELREVLAGLVGAKGPLHYVEHRSLPRVAHYTLLALGLLTAFTTAYLVLRPAEPTPSLSRDDESRLRELLARQGFRDSLGYFALRRDKSVIWSATGKAAIAYRVVSGVMLASGDPIGDPEAWPGAIKEFMRTAEDHAWVPAVMGCSEQGGLVWRREAGLDAIELGDEAIVEVGEFSLEGRAMRNVRQAVGRVQRAGYVVTLRRVRDIPRDEIEVVRRQSAAWRGSETERGFSMALGRFGEPADGDCAAALAYQDGTLRGVLHFVPWGTDGLSLDLMRRDRAAENGVNELLIVETLKQAPGLGIARVSLNFAVFRDVLERGERLGAGPVLRAWRGVLLFLSRWFQIESLYRFNAKFRPIWEPRYLCYPNVSDLPRIGIAALEAEAFLVWPSLRFWRRERPAPAPALAAQPSA